MTESSAQTWLPLLRDAPLLTKSKSFTSHFLKNQKGKDWFLGLAHAMHETKDPQQARMLTKAFLFLYDYMPGGLTGEYAHVRGTDVMDHLLSSKEQAASRHRVTKEADAAWAELETWMSQGDSWKEALRHAKESRRKGNERAPGLYSPASMMAILIIAYPEPDRKERISRLGIDWMIRPRGTLDVRHGFWKGLNISNLHTCFTPAERLPMGQTKLLLDYDRLLGRKFIDARMDMRPFLPAWASHVVRDEDGLLDLEPRGDNHDDHVLVLREFLYPYGTKNIEVLEDWLIGELDKGGGSDALMRWVEHWAGRMDGAKNYEEQTITRSLFSRSLLRLYGISTTEDKKATGMEEVDLKAAYLLLDVEDGRYTNEVVPEARGNLVSMPGYHEYAATTAQVLELSRIRGQATHATLSEIFQQQDTFFHRLAQEASLMGFMVPAIMFDRLRTEALLRETAGPVAEGEDFLGQVKADTTDMLKLTKWQVRELVLPGADMEAILTECQLRIHRQGPGAEVHAAITPQWKPQGAGDGLRQHHALLAKLFGELKDTPILVTTPPRSPPTIIALAPVAREEKAPGPRAASLSPPTSASHASSAGAQKTPTPQPAAVPSKANVPPPERNIFRNRVHAPAKRDADGNVKVHSKAADHLWGLTKDDFRGEMRDAVREDLEGLRAELRGQSSALTTGLGEMETKLQCGLGAVKDDVKAVMEELEAVRDELKSVRDVLGGRADDLCQELHGLTGSLARASKLGDFAAQCPAPQGWEQEAYESQLVRAAWYYINVLGDPDEGVTPDGNALDQTVAKFPGLVQEHIVHALTHIHAEVFKKSFDIMPE